MYLCVKGYRYEKSCICVSGDIGMRSHVFVFQGYEKSCMCASGGIISHVFVCQGVSV